jgi:5-methylcytosine-specific restriction protein B
VLGRTLTINRGNPAQIFGEMLTLLEDSKRRPSEAMELAYRRSVGERIHIPSNLYVIGTMNVADRSLAIVDLALRRRFAFVDLEPELGPKWRAWGSSRGFDDSMLTEIEARISALNAEIEAATSLGPQFRIGHSYVTPDVDETIRDGRAWFRARVETEIGPLLDEYWYDAPEKAKAARAKLLAQFV